MPDRRHRELAARIQDLEALADRAEDATERLTLAVGDVVDIIQRRNAIGHECARLVREIFKDLPPPRRSS